MSQSGDRLKPGQLGTADVTASTVANIGPGIDFYFGFGVIAVTAGVGAPLTILAATVAVGLLAFTVAEFTRAEPSAGSFITYVETALGARAGAATALLVTVGYTVAIAAVFTMSGGLVAMTLSRYTSWHPWWGPISLLLTAGASGSPHAGRGCRPPRWARPCSFRWRSWSRSASWSSWISVPTCRAYRSPGRTSMAAWPAFPQASRWPSSCSSDGKTAPRSPRKPAAPAAPSPGPSTSRWRLRRPCSSSSATRPLPVSATTSPPLAAHRSRF